VKEEDEPLKKKVQIQRAITKKVRVQTCTTSYTPLGERVRFYSRSRQKSPIRGAHDLHISFTSLLGIARVQELLSFDKRPTRFRNCSCAVGTPAKAAKSRGRQRC
jgi:hypothetical protein